MFDPDGCPAIDYDNAPLKEIECGENLKFEKLSINVVAKLEIFDNIQSLTQLRIPFNCQNFEFKLFLSKKTPYPLSLNVNLSHFQKLIYKLVPR